MTDLVKENLVLFPHIRENDRMALGFESMAGTVQKPCAGGVEALKMQKIDDNPAARADRRSHVCHDGFH